MNKRIKELAEQAGWMMSDELDGFNNRLERFTELIVRECIGIIRSYEDDDHYIEKDVRKHFGVEE